MALRSTALLPDLQAASLLRKTLPRLKRNWPELLLVLLASAAYFWNLTTNGWGNPYYAAAAQAGSSNLVSFLYGSADGGNGLTVDKPPLHLWVIALSIKLFGLSSLSVLAPQALMGVATVTLVYRTVAIQGTARQAFIAGLLVILTPVASIIFRFNNPDALLLLLWALAAFLATKSVQEKNVLFLYAAAAVLGATFLCKQFQGWILVPALALAFMVFGFGEISGRIRRLSLSALVMVALPAIWVLIVELTPSTWRPWIGGSAGNSFLELTFGYNGLGRLTGEEGLGATNPKGYEGVVGYDAGILRLLTVNYAPEAAWFLPLAFAGATVSAVRFLRKSLNREQSFGALFHVAWFAATFVILSFMTGDIHPYYTSMIAIPAAILSAQAIETVWVNRSLPWCRRGAALLTLTSLIITLGILTWFEGWSSWVAVFVKILALGAVAVLGLWLGTYRPRLTAVACVLASVALAITPSLFIIESIRTPQQGSFPISGPVPTVESWHRRDAEQAANNEKAKYSQARGEPVIEDISLRLGKAPANARWAAATTGSQNAALYQLQTGRPVMSIGGFSTSDVFPHLGQFKRYVLNGQIVYYIHQPGILEWANSSANTRNVVSWIQENFEYEEVGGARLYDLRRASG